MEHKTYQQLLSEQYDDNAKNVIVHQYEYEGSDVDEHEEKDYDIHDLPEKDAFQKFAGPRNHEDSVIQGKKPSQPTDIRRNKDIRTEIYTIDSAFRAATAMFDGAPSSSSHFLFKPNKVLKNAISVRMTSCEFPNTFYTISSIRGNNSMQITVNGVTKLITISDGNYAKSDGTVDFSQFKTEIEGNLNTAFTGVTTFILSITYPSGKVTLQTSNPTTFFSIVFVQPIVTSVGNLNFIQNTSLSNGLGFYLGFTKYTYSGNTSYTTEGMFPLIGDPYAYLSISDWDSITHASFNQTHYTVFSKILLQGPKNTLVFDNDNTNSTTKEYHFMQPTNINLLEIQMLDRFGNILDLNGANVSMTLEFKTILNPALYEEHREL